MDGAAVVALVLYAVCGMWAVFGFWVLRRGVARPPERGPVPSARAVASAEQVVRDAYGRLGPLYETPQGPLVVVRQRQRQPTR